MKKTLTALAIILGLGFAGTAHAENGSFPSIDSNALAGPDVEDGQWKSSGRHLSGDHGSKPSIDSNALAGPDVKDGQWKSSGRELAGDNGFIPSVDSTALAGPDLQQFKLNAI